MRNEPVVGTRCRAYKTPLDVENELLDLFAPVRGPDRDTPTPRGMTNSLLWRANAIHRARNLAQSTLSLAALAEHPARAWLSHDVALQTRHLARAYEALAQDVGTGAAVPCAPLLTEVATRLVLIFGGARRIEISVAAQPIILSADMRRALILMCSEMVINALKYAFPGAAGGTIRVALIPRNGEIELVVEDDGVGDGPVNPDGNGHRRLAEVGALCGASVVFGSGQDGRGGRVTCRLPVTVARHA